MAEEKSIDKLNLTDDQLATLVKSQNDLKIAELNNLTKSTHTIKPWYASKKLIGAIFTSITALSVYLWANFANPISATEIMICLSPMLAYLGIEGANDLKNR